MQPGWYPDPSEPPGAARFDRWWNGTAWTEHTRPTALGQPARVSYQKAVTIITLFGLAAVLVLVFTGRI